MIELIVVGMAVGVLSGFFGIGGGTILIPLLLMLGFETKEAIGISVVQMAFASIFGSYINHKKGTLDLTLVATIGVGGFVGASLSGYVTALFSDKTLEIFFLCFAIFALARLFMSVPEGSVQKEVAKPVLLLIGAFIGLMSTTIGVGGSIILIPVLVGFLHVELKAAVSAGLFFVVFSSVAGVISHTLSGHVDFASGVLIGVASLAGVYLGIHFKDKIEAGLQKRLLVAFYILVVIYLSKRVLF